MRQIKKLVPKLVSILLCCSMILPVSAAEPPKEAKSKPLSESAVAEYIAAASETRVTKLNGETVIYYLGDGFGVAKDSSGYYLVEYGTDPFWISVNGQMLETRSEPVSSPMIDLPTDWSTIIDTGYQSVDVGDLSYSAAALAVEFAVSTLVPGGVAIAAILSQGITALGYKLLPNGYFITFRFCSKVRVIEIGPTIGEYDDTLTVYLGPGNDKYQNLLIDNHDVYEKPIDGY